MRHGVLPPQPPETAAEKAFDRFWYWKAVSSGQWSPDICFKESEDMPPAHVVQKVVLAPGLELLVVCQGVVQPPDTGGHVVGQEHVYRVVAPRQQQEDHPAEGGEEGGPVEEDKAAWRVLFDSQVAHGQGHGVP